MYDFSKFKVVLNYLHKYLSRIDITCMQEYKLRIVKLLQLKNLFSKDVTFFGS